ncbi:S53 family peptidase [Dyella nitratireducens]|uniref:Sedolisin-B n=1 Tax=Dyella nitratireducens TaxID=1849580 RepID=A0ABQ1GJN9_9GAMM|nr:S53 family peptidase [Dyella nitratireducens]GGA44912.1 sedolisin-B [Dyella nitratireducens]GLQ41249.1 sedolisin-B [Dyella nitratireducens]
MASLRIKSLVVALTVASATSVFAAAQSNVDAMVSVKHATVLHKGDTVVGPLAFSRPMHIVVSLKLRNKAQLDAYLAKPGHKPLTPEQFKAQYAPTASQAKAVADYLTKAGFSKVTIAPNRMLVEGYGHADTAQAAFNTTFVHVHTHDGRDAYANASDVKIPAALQDTVLEVLGTQTVHIAHTFAHRVNPHAVHTDANGSAVAHNPTDYNAIYGASSLAAATSVSVGIITEGSMTNVESDLQQFTSNNGLATVNVQVVGSGSSDTSGDGEWDLDSQDIVGMTGGVQQLVLYDAASLNDSDLTTDYNAVVSANAVPVINVSLGECETNAPTSTDDQIFEQAESQGQTFSVSSGDSGADECGTGGITPSYPASSPYVVAVGGTELYTNNTTTWADETVWNNLSENEGATGGSPSTIESIPSWQQGVGQNGSSQFRGVPDIAFNASPDTGSQVIVDGQSQQIGGTSLASPLFVGSWALIIQAKGSNPGFAAPLIYQDAASNYSTDFHDVTSGNNNGESAAAGWDYTTGFGSLIVGNVASHL